MEISKEVKDFWEPIIYKNGKIDEEQVLKELSDFYFIMQEVPKVYCEITGGTLSKLMYKAENVLTYFEDLNYDKKITQEDIQMFIDRCDDPEELKDELREYFDLTYS